MTVLGIEQILHKFEDQKIVSFFQPRTGQFSRDPRHMCRSVPCLVLKILAWFAHIYFPNVKVGIKVYLKPTFS